MRRLFTNALVLPSVGVDQSPKADLKVDYAIPDERNVKICTRDFDRELSRLSELSVSDLVSKSDKRLKHKDADSALLKLEAALKRHSMNDAALRAYVRDAIQFLSTYNGRAGAPHPATLSVIRLANKYGHK